jgi:hypothetical protein
VPPIAVADQGVGEIAGAVAIEPQRGKGEGEILDLERGDAQHLVDDPGDLAVRQAIDALEHPDDLAEDLPVPR